MGGTPREAEFFVDGDRVYPMPITSPVTNPWFDVIGGFAYRTRHHPDGESRDPAYEMVGAFCYPARGSPEGNPNRSVFQVRPGSE
jgi:hypothetical protein